MMRITTVWALASVSSCFYAEFCLYGDGICWLAFLGREWRIMWRKGEKRGESGFARIDRGIDGGSADTEVRVFTLSYYDSPVRCLWCSLVVWSCSRVVAVRVRIRMSWPYSPHIVYTWSPASV